MNDLTAELKKGGADMTKDESIALAIKLHKGYEEIERLQDKISENENYHALHAALMPKHYYAMSYFKPYLAGSIIFFLAMILPEYTIFWICTFLDKSAGNNDNSYVPYVAAAIIAAIFALIHLIGGFAARNKCRYMNNLEQEKIRGEQRKCQRLLQENEDLKVMLYSEKTRLEEYNDIVPSGLRNSGKMSAVKKLLLSGKAESFTDAIALLNSQHNQI